MPDSLIAVAQPGDHPRVLLTLTWAVPRSATVVRINPDGSLVPVRNAEPANVLGGWVGYDHEMPLDRAVTYRATEPGGTTLTSSAVTVASLGHTYLRHLARPTLSRRVTIREPGPRSLPARRGVARPIDRADPIVVHQVRGTDQGALQIITANSAAEIAALRAMFADGSPLLLQTPLTWGGDCLYLSVDTVGFETLIRYGPQLRRIVTVPFDAIGRPPGTAGGAVGSTYADLDAKFTTYSAMTATSRTYASLTTAP